MYRPAHFAEDHPETLHQAIRQIGLANLITVGPDGIEANPVPMVIDPSPAPFGTLYGHVARANRQWTHGGDALAIFQGPDAYVTPSWYPGKTAAGKAVPTWNYVTVHARGRLEAIEEPERLLRILARLTNHFEAGRSKPWAVTDAPHDFVMAQMTAIVGFALPITRLEGKWKLSQNRTPEDQAGVRDGLRRDGKTVIAEVMSR
ncbi:MAG: FMN-binding negative transcriptional regulator [Magnetospirillum sp.]|nr:MAG: FMN-binding negative transcriptional regulator [Magnetospirillum sp.]